MCLTWTPSTEKGMTSVLRKTAVLDIKRSDNPLGACATKVECDGELEELASVTVLWGECEWKDF